MNFKEAIRENQKRNRLFWLIRHCITTTELEMRRKKAEEDKKAQEQIKKYRKNNYKTNKKK